MTATGYPMESKVTVERPENWAGVTPFVDRFDGSKWYGILRCDFWCLLFLVSAFSAAAGALAVGWYWGRQFGGVRAMADRYGTDSWTDSDGFYHEVVRYYDSRSYGELLRFQAKFPCDLHTNVFRKVSR